MSHLFSEEMLPHEVDPADTLYVADRNLDIVYSNAEWSRFATDNKGRKLLDDDWNQNVLANLKGKERDRWRHIYRLLLEGRLPHHQETMNCSSPEERRIYQLRVTPERDEAGDVAWLIHHNVRIDGKQDAVDRIGHRLEALDDHERLVEIFQQRIVERRIRIPGFQVARHFEPLEEIGGDFLWHREYAEGLHDLIHADVMGHGVAAGRVAAKLAVMLDEMASVDLSPSGTVAALSEALARTVPGDEVLFATGLGFRFEPHRQRVTCCNFGHESPIFSRAGPVRIRGGVPVGLGLSDKPWTETVLDLTELGSRFLVFSDGITEQFNPDGEMFETAGLHRAFRRYLDAPLDEMVRGIVDELTSFRGAALVKDDQTLLALDFQGDPASGG